MQTLKYAYKGDQRDVNMWCKHYFSYRITSLGGSLALQEVKASRISRQSAHEGGKAVSPTPAACCNYYLFRFNTLFNWYFQYGTNTLFNWCVKFSLNV
jgi:hypothetical protein